MRHNASSRMLGVLLFATTILHSVCAQPQALSCPVGFGPNAAGRSCVPCQPGTYAAAIQGGNGCLDCPIGFYSDGIKAKACTPCPRGLWTGYKGAKSKGSCYPCYPTDSIPQTPQPDGHGGMTCQRCPAGSLVSAAGGCVKCSGNGQFILNARSCSKCPAGTRHNGKGAVHRVSEACTPCGFNTYQDKAGQSSCKPCPAGTIVLNTKARAASACKPYVVGKKVSFLETISSDVKEQLYSPRRSLYKEQKSSTSVQRTVVSGKRVPCDRAASKRLVSYDGGKFLPASVEGQSMQCLHYTFYVRPGNLYGVIVEFRVPFKGTKEQAITGRLGRIINNRVKYQEPVVKGARQYLLTEDIQWKRVTQL